MADPDLNESAWQRAVAEAGGIYPTTAFEVGATLMTILCGAIAAAASADQSTQTLIAASLIGGALALLLSFGVVFVTQLATAPVRQRNELRRAWGTAEPAKPANIELTLRNERRKASGFYRVKQGGGVIRGSANQKGAEEWTNRIVDLLSEHLDADAARDFIEASKGIDGFKARLDAQAAALDRIIERLTKNQ